VRGKKVQKPLKIKEFPRPKSTFTNRRRDKKKGKRKKNETSSYRKLKGRPRGRNGRARGKLQDEALAMTPSRLPGEVKKFKWRDASTSSY